MNERIDRLYNIVPKQDEDTTAAVFIITLFPTHEVFDGHFPGQPVLPGVLQLRMIIDGLGRAIGKEVSLQKIVQAKYLNFIDPTQAPTLTLTVTWKEQADVFHAQAVLKDENVVFSKISLEVAPK